MSTSGIGGKLKQLREAAGLSQEALAARAGVSYSTISKLEQGSVTRPSASTLQKVVSALQFDLDLLLSDKPLPTTHASSASKATSPVKFVYFDIGGVLAHTESMLLQYLSASFDRPLSKVKTLYHQYSPLAMRGKLQMQDIQLLFLFKLNLDWRRYRQYMFTDWVEHMKPNPAAQEFARQVAANYPVGLLTNIVDGMLPRMQKRGLVPDLPYKVVVESCKVGLAKPEPAIYELAAKLAGYHGKQILFIDDQKVNVKAARAAGWQAEWFNETKTEASIERIRRKYF